VEKQIAPWYATIWGIYARDGPHFAPLYFPSRALLTPYWAAQIHAGKGVSEKA